MYGFDSSVAMDLMDWENGDNVDNEERADARRRVLLHSILRFRCDIVVRSERCEDEVKKGRKRICSYFGRNRYRLS